MAIVGRVVLVELVVAFEDAEDDVDAAEDEDALELEVVVVALRFALR